MMYRRNNLYKTLSYLGLALAIILLLISAFATVEAVWRVSLIVLGLVVLVITFIYFRLSGQDNKDPSA
jgi:predicted membrane channel-forming protein YqfA (hemolysin III family)